MDPFLSQLAGLCRSRRTGVKWVFVPSHAIGHTLGERLVLEGTDWANLRFTTPFEVALQMAAPFLVERGVDPVPGGLGPALVMRLLLGLPEAVPRYFRDLAEQPKMAEALWATIHELRMAGLASADLPRGAFVSGSKRAELVALVAAYEEHLAANCLADGAAVYLESLQHLDVGPVLPGDVRLELPDVVWAPLEQRLLDALPGERLTPLALEVPGLGVPRRVQSPCRRSLIAPRSDAERLVFLMRAAEALATRHDGTLVMFKAGGREAEVEEVLRRVLRDGIPLDQVEIACASAAHATLVWEKAQRHGLPVTVGPGVPIVLTRPARALLSFCEWAENGFPAGGLRRLLQSGDVRLEGEDGPTAGQAARLLARSEATWGRETYGLAMTALAAVYRARADDLDVEEAERARSRERAGQAERLGAWIARLLALLPVPAEGRVPIDRLAACCSAFVAELANKTSELDGEASAVLVESLQELRAVGGLERPLAEAFAFVRHQTDGVRVGGDRARPGHLYVTGLDEAGYAGRPHTFVVGLEEGWTLPAALEDPVLLDGERQSLSADLPTSADRITEALHRVVSRLGALGGRVCLSYSCRDLREHRQTFPSWLLLQAFRLLRKDPTLTYQDLLEALGEPVSLVPAAAGQAIAESGWWLTHLNGVGPPALPAVHAAFPWLARGEAAEAERDADVLTAWDGFVPEAGPLLDPRTSGRPVAATTLEDFARCPFRHFLQRALGLDPIETAEPEGDRWLPPWQRGQVLHDLYAAILREVRAGGGPLDVEAHGRRLAALAEARLAETARLMPPPSEYVFQRERQTLLEDCLLFLQLEAREPRVPMGFEVSFGSGPPEGEPLAQAEPVTIDLGRGVVFRLRGRIDRVDRLRDGSYEVIDYKTGGYWPSDFTGTFQGGRLLQHALYALAATELLRRTDGGARVSRSCYYLPTARGQGERVVCPPVSRDQVAAVLRDLFDVAAAGAFVHARDKGDCKWCDFGPACGPRPYERAGAKLANPANQALDAYRRLSRHA